MSSMIDISEKKISKRISDIIASATNKTKSIKRKNASLGNLKSSATFNEVLKIYQDSFTDAGDVIKAESEWVIEQALRVGNRTKLKLIENAKVHFEGLASTAKLNLEETANIVGEPKLLSRNLPLIGQKIESELGDVISAIEGRVIASRNKGIKGFVNIIFGWLLKLIGK